MRIKKLGIIVLVVAVSFSMTGCSSSEQEDSPKVQVSSSQVVKNEKLDEANIRKLCEAMSPEGDMDTRRRAYPVKNLPGGALLTTALYDGAAEFQNNVDRGIKAENIKISNIQQDGNHATADISYTVNGQQVNEHTYFLKINGEWHFDLDDVKAAYRTKISGYDGAMVKMEANLGYTYNNDPIVVLDMQSKASKNYMAGWVEPMKVMLVTDKGEFPVKNTAKCYATTSPVKVTSVQPTRVFLPFAGASGTPKALRVIGFNELNNRGLPLNGDNAQTITLNIDSIGN